VPPRRITLSPSAFVSACCAFLLIGALAALYGPLFDEFTRRYDVGVSTVGFVVSAHFAGALAGVVTAMAVIERVDGHVAIRGALGLLALGCAGVAVAPTLPALLAAVLLLGTGFGGLDYGLNQLVAHSSGARSPARLNVLNAQYGVGAVLGPLAVTVVGQRNATALYAGAAAVAAALALGLRGMSGRLPAPATGDAGRTARRGSLLAIFVVAYVLYLGVETGVGGWMPTHLERLGYAAGTAAALTSAFWGALALGRLAVVPVTARVREPVIVVASTCAAVATLLLALVPGAAVAGYVLTGVALAPVFPTGLAWLARLDPGNPRTTSWLLAVTMLGGVLFPPAVGVVIAWFGAAWAPAVLAALATGSLAAFAAAARRRPPAS
jgi:fucose permease